MAGAMIGLAFGTIYYPNLFCCHFVQLLLAAGIDSIRIRHLHIARGSARRRRLHIRETQTRFGSPPADFSISACRPPRIYRSVAQSGGPSIATHSLVAHVGLSLEFGIVAGPKNLGTLIAYAAAMMLGTQFWYAHSGGLALRVVLAATNPDNLPAESGRPRCGVSG